MPETDEYRLFQAIAGDLVASQAGVRHGKMMSHPAVTYDRKVFAFYSNTENDMVFRLGRDTDVEALGIGDYAHLAPFRNKPPMRDWFRIAANQSDRWRDLADVALRRMRLPVE